LSNSDNIAQGDRSFGHPWFAHPLDRPFLLPPHVRALLDTLGQPVQFV